MASEGVGPQSLRQERKREKKADWVWLGGQKTMKSRLEFLWEQRKDSIRLAELESWQGSVLWSNDRISLETGQRLSQRLCARSSPTPGSDGPEFVRFRDARAGKAYLAL